MHKYLLIGTTPSLMLQKVRNKLPYILSYYKDEEYIRSISENPFNEKLIIDSIVSLFHKSEGRITIDCGQLTIHMFKEIVNKIASNGDVINGIIIKSTDTVIKENTLNLYKYKKQYNDHSRWMDYAPDYIESQQLQYLQYHKHIIEESLEIGINIVFLTPVDFNR